jgi:1,3-beta-glucan synthase
MFRPFLLVIKFFANNLHSRQIRPPIYSLKQTKLRKRRIVRYAILYFTLFFLFMILLIAPAVIGNLGLLDTTFENLYGSSFMYLMQPTNWNNNDTTSSKTGSGLPNQAAQTAAGTAKASASSTRRAMYAF